MTRTGRLARRRADRGPDRWVTSSVRRSSPGWWTVARLVLPALLVLAGSVLPTWAAEPSPVTEPSSPESVGPVASPIVGGRVDARSEGEGPGLAGDPLTILAAVVLLGCAAAAGTAIVVRLTRDG